MFQKMCTHRPAVIVGGVIGVMMPFVRSFVLILTRNNRSELRAPVRAGGQALQLANASARTRRRRHISCPCALHMAKNTEAVISEGEGEGDWRVEM